MKTTRSILAIMLTLSVLFSSVLPQGIAYKAEEMIPEAVIEYASDDAQDETDEPIPVDETVGNSQKMAGAH